MGASRRSVRRVRRKNLSRDRKAFRRAFLAGVQSYLEQRSIIQRVADEWDFLADLRDEADQ